MLISNAKRPPHRVLEGRTVRLEPLDPDRHGADLYASAKNDRAHWAYLPYGPFADQAAFENWYWEHGLTADPKFYAFVDQRRDLALGVASFLRIQPQAASIEIGHVRFPPPLQRTVLATEGLYLMARHAFDDLNHRRLEWKCNAANAASMRAARRLGFTFEGTFRQATIAKGANRDTAWFSLLDSEWPALDAGFKAWLSTDNFDSSGAQQRSLTDCFIQTGAKQNG